MPTIHITDLTFIQRQRHYNSQQYIFLLNLWYCKWPWILPHKIIMHNKSDLKPKSQVQLNEELNMCFTCFSSLSFTRSSKSRLRRTLVSFACSSLCLSLINSSFIASFFWASDDSWLLRSPLSLDTWPNSSSTCNTNDKCTDGWYLEKIQKETTAFCSEWELKVNTDKIKAQTHTPKHNPSICASQFKIWLEVKRGMNECSTDTVLILWTFICDTAKFILLSTLR